MLSSDLCPEDSNSTDCLLRRLINLTEEHYRSEAGEFNWDPITFAFTAPIGILAFVFTLVAVFQALLAASTCRRRCDSRAIGPWSRRTRKKWSWRELNNFYSATTPILRIETLLRLSPEAQGELQEKTEASQDTEASELHSNTSNGVGLAASWPRFLKKLGLHGLEDEGVLQQYDFKTTLVDYLPDDLIAAPAYVEVGFVVASTAVVGVRSMKTDAQSPYPVIIGDDFQFDFRQHPILGVVGAFSSFREDRTQVRSPYNQIARACRHADGRITMGNHLFRGLEYPHHTIRLFCSRSAGVISHRRYQVQLWELTTHDCSRHIDTTEDIPFYLLLDKYNLAWLLLADIPDFVPSIFPTSRALPDPKIATMFALNSRFWSSCGRKTPGYMRDTNWKALAMTLRSRIPSVSFIRIRRGTRSATEEDVAYVSYLMAQDKWDSGIPEGGRMSMPLECMNSEAENRRDIFYGIDLAFEACEQLLTRCEEFHASFNALTLDGKKFLRSVFLLQIQEIDLWLGRNDLPFPMVQCRTRSIFARTTMLLNVEVAVTDAEFGFSPNATTLRNPRSSGLEPGDLSHEIAIRHFTTLQTLGVFLEQFEDYLYEQHRMDTGLSVGNTTIHYLTQLRCIMPSDYNFEFSPSDHDYDYDTTLTCIASLRRTTDLCWSRCKRKGMQVESRVLREQVQRHRNDPGHKDDQKTTEEPREKQEQRLEVLEQENLATFTKYKERRRQAQGDENNGSATIGHAIDDVLVWRVLLIYLLFSTTPDCSALQTSGVWNQVIPLL